jgi:hypothetical protein
MNFSSTTVAGFTIIDFASLALRLASLSPLEDRLDIDHTTGMQASHGNDTKMDPSVNWIGIGNHVVVSILCQDQAGMR